MFDKTKIKPIIHVEWLGRNGLAHYLEQTWGSEWKHRDFVWNDAANDTYHRFDIDADERLDDYDRKAYEKAKNKGYIETYEMRSLLLGLIEDGHLAHGDYLIHVTW